MRYIDPGGHICVQNNGGLDEFAIPGNCNGGEDPKYNPNVPLTPMGWTPKEPKKERKVDLKFDPYYGPYVEDLEDGSLTLEQLENIDAVWDSANDAYVSNGIDLDEVAANVETNPLSQDEINEVLSVPAYLRGLLVDRSTHRPYGWFLQVLGEQMDANLLPIGDEQGYMQFEANYLAALMRAYPLVLEEAKISYQEEFADEFITDYSSDLIQEFLDKFRLFPPSTVP